MIDFNQRRNEKLENSILQPLSCTKKNIKKYKSEFIPIDSEHFSVWSLMNNTKSINIEKVFLSKLHKNCDMYKKCQKSEERNN